MGNLIEVRIHNGVADVHLNRPGVHNALNETLIAQVTKAFQELGIRRDVRVILITAAGTSFCAGGDIAWMKKTATYSREENLADAGQLAAMYQAIRECPKPVIARVHGAAFGGGVGLAAAADIAVALESAVFCFSEVRLGIMPAVILPFIVAKTGTGPLFRTMMTAEKFSAEEAKRIGLVSEVANSTADLDKKIHELCEDIKKGGPEALRVCKELLLEFTEQQMKLRQSVTTARIAEIRVSSEGQEGLSAFLEKRKPSWLR